MNTISEIEKIYIDTNSTISQVLRKLSILTEFSRSYILILPVGTNFGLSNILFYLIAERVIRDNLNIIIQTHDEKSYEIINATALTAVKELNEIDEDLIKFSKLKLEEYKLAQKEKLEKPSATHEMLIADSESRKSRKEYDISDVEVINEFKSPDISEESLAFTSDLIEIANQESSPQNLNTPENPFPSQDNSIDSISSRSNHFVGYDEPSNSKSNQAESVDSDALVSPDPQDSVRNEEKKKTFEELYNLALSQKAKVSEEEPKSKNVDISEILDNSLSKKVKHNEPENKIITKEKLQQGKYQKVNGFEIVAGGDIALFTEARYIAKKGLLQQPSTFDIDPFSNKYLSSTTDLSSINQLPSDNKLTLDSKGNLQAAKNNSTKLNTKTKISISAKELLQEKKPKKLLGHLKKNFSESRFPPTKVIKIISIFPIILLIFGVYYYTIPKVDIIIKPIISENSITKDLTISITNDDVKGSSTENLLVSESLTLEKSILKEKLVETSVDIGSESRGKVTLSNKTFQELIIPAATRLSINLSGKTLYFTTNSNITIPASISSFAGTTNGIIDVGVTATAKGDEYNVPAQSGANRFVLDGFDKATVEGTNFTSFTGGFSKIVKKVTDADLNALSTNAKEELKPSLLADLKTKYQDSYILINPEGEFDILKEEFSANVGDQTDKVTVDLSMKVKIFGISKSSIEKMASELFTQTQKEIALSPGQITQSDNQKFEYTFDIINKASNELKATLTIKGKFLNKFNSEVVTKSLIGSDIAKIDREISAVTTNQFQVTAVTYSENWLPDILKKVPINQSNIRYIFEKVNL